MGQGPPYRVVVLTIYAIPVSLYCAKLRLLLRHKALTWEEIPPPGGYGSDTYKQVVPSGNLPALVDREILIADSEAIAEYLEDCHPDPAMLPEDRGARAKVRERSRFHDTRLEPGVRVLFRHLGATAAPAETIRAQSAEISQRLAQLGRLLPDHAGQTLTLADCGFPITFAWIEALTPRLGLQIVWPAQIQSYRERLSAHQAVTDELNDYLPKLKAYLS